MKDMDTILNSDEYTEVDGRGYVNPQVALDESNRFIDQLRATQAQQNQQIAQDTYNLGTSVPSVQGGLGTNTPAGMSYFTSRIQNPQTSSAVANLRATAQAAALNQALQNEQEIWKKRYNDAYRAYQKRQNDKTNQGTDLGDILKNLGIDTNENEPGTEGNNSVDIYDSESFTENIGKVLPMSDTASKWRDPATGYWYVVTPPKEIDAIAISNSIAGRNPVNGMTTTVNGKNFIYDASKDMWYERGPYIFGQGD